MYIYTYIYIYICIYIYIYIYIYIRTPSCRTGVATRSGQSDGSMNNTLNNNYGASDVHIFANFVHGGEYPHESSRSGAASTFNHC